MFMGVMAMVLPLKGLKINYKFRATHRIVKKTELIIWTQTLESLALTFTPTNSKLLMSKKN
jgi:hypothetical protein